MFNNATHNNARLTNIKFYNEIHNFPKSVQTYINLLAFMNQNKIQRHYPFFIN